MTMLHLRNSEKRSISNRKYVFILISLEGRVFANGLGDLGSIPGRVIPKTLKIVLDTSLLNTQQYKVRIKSKVEQSRERSSTLHYTSVEAIEKGFFWSPSTTVANFTLLYYVKRLKGIIVAMGWNF